MKQREHRECMERMQAKWNRLLVGMGAAVSKEEPDITTAIRKLSDEALDLRNRMVMQECSGSLWDDASSATDSADLTTSYSRLLRMATAYCTEGSPTEGDESLKQAVLQGLRRMHDHRYYREAKFYGNWWHWEIGAPQALVDTVLLMRSHLNSEDIRTYMNDVDGFAPDPVKFLGSRWPAQVSTGANRVWICKVIAVRSILLGDADMLLRVRDALSDLFAYVTAGDGFHEDGSFLQHESHPYTGGYGKYLIADLVLLLHLLHETPFAIREESWRMMFNWIYDAFDPLMFRGSMMDMASGREISRSEMQNHESGHMVISAMLILSACSPEPHATRLKRISKSFILADTSRSYVLHAPTYPAGLAAALLRDSGIALRPEPTSCKLFPDMGRASHRRPGYALGIGMSSKRIATYESINRENLKGWYTGHGYTSLYDSDLQQYSDGYWPTVNPYRLAGTTVTSLPRADSFGHRHLSEQSWAGGVALQGRYGSAGMQLEDYKTADETAVLCARKSWFMFDEGWMAVGSGICSDAPVRVETIVDNRKLNETGTNRCLMDGQELPSEARLPFELQAVTWLHLTGNVPGADIGYYFPGSTHLQGIREQRTGRWSDIGAGPSDELARHYLTLWLNHGLSPDNAKYAYMVLPGASSEAVARYAGAPPVEIVANDTRVHAVHHRELCIWGAHFWTDEFASAGPLTCDGQAAVMTKTDETFIAIAISDPTQENQGAIILTLNCAAREVDAADATIEVLQLQPVIRLRFHAKGTRGRTSSVTLRR